jgi:saccharopine dehydrogenase (NAD+, L-lysine forming)
MKPFYKGMFGWGLSTGFWRYHAVKIGIRREDKNIWERRAPLNPDHVRKLVAQGIEVRVQPSPIRAFPEEAYRQAGATISEDLSACPVVFAIKEIPPHQFVAGHAYMYFAHVIKGQPHNMFMLQRLLDLKCTLLDYEKVTDEAGKRLIFFGRHAGLAGMIDSLWALGRRLQAEGYSTPFLRIKQTHQYPDLEHARAAFLELGRAIVEKGLPAPLAPMVFGFTGYGNVSQGAQEIFDLLPHQQVAPAALPAAMASTGNRTLLKVVFKEEHMFEPVAPGASFGLQDYFDHPERYRGVFERYLPDLTVLMNCIYWAPRYPRLVDLAQVRKLYGPGQPRLRVIGDISCDINGAIECNRACTEPDEPAYV